MTDKSDDRVGHLNTILAQGGGNLNDLIFKSSNALALPRKGRGGCSVKFRVDQRIKRSTVSLLDCNFTVKQSSSQATGHPFHTKSLEM